MKYLIIFKENSYSRCNGDFYELIEKDLDKNIIKVKELSDRFNYIYTFSMNDIELIEADNFFFKKRVDEVKINKEPLKLVKLEATNDFKDKSFTRTNVQVFNETEDLIQIEYKYPFGYCYPVLYKNNYDIETLEVYYTENEQDNYLDSYDLDR